VEIILRLWFVTTINESGARTNGVSVLFIFRVLRMSWELFLKDQTPLLLQTASEQPMLDRRQIYIRTVFLFCSYISEEQ
jgi:hypothetical protein